MKASRWIVFLMCTAMVIACLPIAAFAVTRSKSTSNYGTLSGTINQSGTSLTTTTSVSENEHGGYLHTILTFADGNNTTLYSSHYVGGYGERSLTNTPNMVGIIRAAVYPSYVFYCAEIRGGTMVGDTLYQTFPVDTSVFS